MSISSVFTLGNAIRLMVVGGVVAVFLVIVQSCQSPKSGIERFASGSLSKLYAMESPPVRPDMTFKTIDGQEMRLADYEGQVVLLNVWATWCPPCVAEMPTLDALQERRGDEDFEVITVSLDRQPVEPAQFFAENGIETLKPWHDASYALSAKVQAPGLPMSIFYNRSGREVARIGGEADWTSEEALALVDYLKEY